MDTDNESESCISNTCSVAVEEIINSHPDNCEIRAHDLLKTVARMVPDASPRLLGQVVAHAIFTINKQEYDRDYLKEEWNGYIPILRCYSLTGEELLTLAPSSAAGFDLFKSCRKVARSFASSKKRKSVHIDVLKEQLVDNYEISKKVVDAVEPVLAVFFSWFFRKGVADMFGARGRNFLVINETSSSTPVTLSRKAVGKLPA